MIVAHLGVAIFLARCLKYKDRYAVPPRLTQQFSAGRLMSVDQFCSNQAVGRAFQLRRIERKGQLTREPWLYRVYVTGNHVYRVFARERGDVVIDQLGHQSVLLRASTEDQYCNYERKRKSSSKAPLPENAPRLESVQGLLHGGAQVRLGRKTVAGNAQVLLNLHQFDHRSAPLIARAQML